MAQKFTGDAARLFDRDVKDSAPADFRDQIKPGEPVPVADRRGEFAFWRIPLLVANTDAGFMDVNRDNEVDRFGFAAQSRNGLGTGAPSILGMPRDAITKLAATVLGSGTPQSAPILVTLDGAAQLAWQVKSTASGDEKVALVTPGVAFRP